MNRIVEGYCDGCRKIKDGRCEVYANPIAKTAADRGGHLGCAFSPIEYNRYLSSLPVHRRRTGQQKQKKKK